MSLKNQITAWIVLLVFFGLLLWVFRGILLPFVLGITLAYLLNPFVDWLEEHKVRRAAAALIVMLIALLLLVTAFLLIVPLLIQQGFGLARNIPGYVQQLQSFIETMIPRLEQWIGPERLQELERGLEQMFADSIGMLTGITGTVMQQSMSIINTIGVLIVTPVVAFYLLLDWDRMVESVDNLFPPAHRSEMRALFKSMDRALAGFVRGQGAVVGILAIYYAATLSLAGLSFGLAIGLIAGLFSFIPYVGVLIGFVLSMGVALVQFWPDWIMIAVILGIYLFGQFLEGNVLYPKLVGSSIGVHPVWLMFSLFAFAVLFGAVGVIIAVPLAAISGVLVRWAVTKYKTSPLYDPDSKLVISPTQSSPIIQPKTDAEP
ncbi:AI-2E family transporter [Pelagibacterium sp. 26DY04]|uniref:AI-2E family transporter n=1 Tax=unclassified Pelagibacterium TaxID=2623280 RepID=UPI00281669C3|nr:MULTISPECIES: AI-2E family transporter [unclassified Pelagibacterium]WMT85330.1 AI-2E family transporter [Pelagibacterium sp. 26DY04]WMT90365.1 AI-2E family transporter [Pelagibacterium sp. H642]